MTAKEQHKEEMWEAFIEGVELFGDSDDRTKWYAKEKFDQWYEENFSDPESLRLSFEEGWIRRTLADPDKED